jgi:hypothetical protein
VYIQTKRTIHRVAVFFLMSIQAISSIIKSYLYRNGMYLMHLLSGVPVCPSKWNLQGSTGFLGAISQLLTGPGCVNACVRKHIWCVRKCSGHLSAHCGGNCKKGQSHKIYSQTGSTTRLNLIIYFDGLFWSRAGSCAPCAPSTNELRVTKVFMGKSYRFR